MVYRLRANRPKRILLLDPHWNAAREFLEQHAGYLLADLETVDDFSTWDPLPDLVVLALDHPDLDAADWLERFSQFRGELEIPLAVLDAAYDPAKELQAHQSGAEDFWVRSEDAELTASRFGLFFKRHGRSLADLQGFLGGLFRNLPNTGVIWFDQQLDVLLAGGELLYKLGLTAADMIGKPMRLNELELVCEGFEKYCRLALEGKGGVLETQEDELELFLHFLPQSLSTGILSGLVVIQDVTPQRAEGEHRILEGIGDSLDLLIAYVDNRQKYLYANRAYCDWIDRPMSDILHKEIFSVLSPGHYQKIQPHIDKALSGERVQFELSHHFESLGLRQLLLSYTPHSAYGKVQGFLVVAQDVSQLRESHRKLQFFRQLMDQSNDLFLVATFEDGQLIDFNQTACERLGYTQEELARLRILDFDAKLRDLAHWSDVAQQTKEKGTRLIDSVALTKSGQKFPVEVSSHYVELEGRGYFVVVVRDITERLQRETAELERQMELSSIFKAFGDLYLWMTRKGEIKGYQVSDFGDLLLPPHRVIGAQIEELVPPEAARHIREAIEEMGPHHRMHQIEYVQCKGEQTLYFEGRILPVLGNQILLIARNVTDTKQAQYRLGQVKEELGAQGGLPTIGIWECQLPQGAMAFSDQMAEFLGLEPEQHLDLPSFLEHVPPEERAEVGHLIEQARSKGENFKHGHRLIDNQGATHHILHRAVAMQLDGGRPDRLLGLIQDLEHLDDL